MQLTNIQCLTSDSQSNTYEIAAVAQSTLSTTPLSILRWGNVTPSEAMKSMQKDFGQRAASEFQVPRISTLLNEAQPPSEAYAEHLVIRDLDMDHIEASAAGQLTPGRIVAHADYRYVPAFGDESNQPETDEDRTKPSNSFPPGFNTELHLLLDEMIESTLLKLFRGLPFFGLYGISTLTPTHLRKGIAKRLTEWIFPHSDHFSLPVVLCASPLGLPLYRKCGFEEYRQYDVIIDLSKFGGEGIHQHVTMVRRPKDTEAMPTVWKEWRETHKPMSFSST